MTACTATPEPKLTARQLEVLAFVAGYIREKKYAPTIREICAAFSFASSKAGWDHLDALRKKRLVTWVAKRAGSLRLTRAGKQRLAAEQREVPS